jgi:hypothetical protein
MNSELDKFDSAQQQPPVLKLEVNVNEVNLILQALAELPHRVADPVIRKVFTQAQEQIQAN